MRLFSLLFLLILCSCKESEQERKERLVKVWSGHEIAFPTGLVCLAGKDTVNYAIPNAEFILITFVDSAGCAGFRKKLTEWKALIDEVKLYAKDQVAVRFFVEPDDMSKMCDTLCKKGFIHPVFYDVPRRVNSLNRFSDDVEFRSFLINRDLQVVAMGNPVLNPKAKEEYKKIVLASGIGKKFGKLRPE